MADINETDFAESRFSEDFQSCILGHTNINTAINTVIATINGHITGLESTRETDAQGNPTSISRLSTETKTRKIAKATRLRVAFKDMLETHAASIV